MKYCLAEIILAASNGDEESAFWMQMLALVILAGLVGVGSLIKTRTNRLKKQRQYYGKRARNRYTQPRWKMSPLRELKNKCIGIFSRAAQAEVITGEPGLDFDAAATADQERPGDKRAKERDSANGMELLEVDFLVSTVENTKGDNKNDVTMRKLTFGELVRRERLDTVDSSVLKIYATNERNLYGKDIQYRAMKELAERTEHEKR